MPWRSYVPSDIGWRRATAIFGATAVAAGAFGAHALGSHPRLDTWRTAALYHLCHAIALALPGLSVMTRWCFAGGITIFSGSLYALVLLDEPRLGAVTPLGGVAFITGWISLGWSKR
ncbi:MAG: DUF423 domain-containing protein [Deltaproteobacteria bacterium]|nr:DUF423 domain-containing protein [Deltaproteobacteria bacterium]